MNNPNINITSEIGRLKTVFLHRPGEELHNLVPHNLDLSLFEDIPYLKEMQREHDNFAEAVSSLGAKVFYIEDFLRDILKDKSAKSKILHDIIGGDILGCEYIEKSIFNYLYDLDAHSTAKCLIKGLSVKDIKQIKTREVLSDYMPAMYMFYLPPIPNMYFMRDAAAVINFGLSIHSMKNPVRNRESHIIRAIYRYHEFFTSQPVPMWYDNYNQASSLEGGDILVLNDSSVAVGVSQRTDTSAVQILADNLFRLNSGIKSVYAVQLPKIRAFMHLDTVFTMVDYDKFTIYPSIDTNMNIVKLTQGKDGINYQRIDTLKSALQDALNIKTVQLIESGGGDAIIAAREQWNDSTNTFVLSPGVVVAYERNEVSNCVLAKNKIKVITVKGSELVRGRGGPRCMTMPVCREDI